MPPDPLVRLPSDREPIAVEVVIAPPAIYLIPIKELLRGDFKVAAQNAYVKTSGAYTGEIRYVLRCP